MIDTLQSGGIITNYNCNAACRHCLYNSSPRRDRQYMTEDSLQRILRKGGELGCRSWHIGGGEPFLNFPKLLELIRIMTGAGHRLEYLETNAGWFKNPDQARDMLKNLQSAGCHTIMVSVCPFHAEYIPMKKVKGVIQACKESGMGLFLWQEQFYRDMSVLDEKSTHNFDEMDGRFGKGYMLKTARSFGLRMNGRALQTLKPFMGRKSVEQILMENSGTCRELLNTSHFHIDLYENYIPPGCVGFSIPLQGLGCTIDKESLPCFSAAAEGGIAALYTHAEKAGFLSQPDGYVSKCDLCLSLRMHMKSLHPKKDHPDLQPDGFYNEYRDGMLS